MAPAGLLALQRSAGNRAAVAALRVQRWPDLAGTGVGLRLPSNTANLIQALADRDAEMAGFLANAPTEIDTNTGVLVSAKMANTWAGWEPQVRAAVNTAAPKGRLPLEKDEAVELAQEKTSRRANEWTSKALREDMIGGVTKARKKAAAALKWARAKSAKGALSGADVSRVRDELWEAHKVTSQLPQQNTWVQVLTPLVDGSLLANANRLKERAITTGKNRIGRSFGKAILGRHLGIGLGKATERQSGNKRELMNRYQPDPLETPDQRQHREDHAITHDLKTGLGKQKEGLKGVYTPYHRNEMTDQQKSTDEWRYATVSANNSPVLGGLGSILYKRYRVMERIRDNEGRRNFKTKLEALEVGQYGGTGHAIFGGGLTIGNVMNDLSMLQRGMHLLGGLSGLLALASGIAGIWCPPALAVMGVATALSVAFHAALALVSAILLTYNGIRYLRMDALERERLAPQMKRDAIKLVLGILGVVTGGLGLGGVFGAMHYTASTVAAIHGTTDTALHAAELGTDAGVEAVGDTVMAYGTGYYDRQEATIHDQQTRAGVYDPKAFLAQKGMHVQPTRDPSLPAPVVQREPDGTPGAPGLPPEALEELKALGELSTELRAVPGKETPLIGAERKAVGAAPGELSGLDTKADEAKSRVEEGVGETKKIDGLLGDAVSSSDGVKVPTDETSLRDLAAVETKVDDVERKTGEPLEEPSKGDLMDDAKSVDAKVAGSGGRWAWLKARGSKAWRWLSSRTGSLKRRAVAALRRLQAKLGDAVLKVVGMDKKAAEIKKGTSELAGEIPERTAIIDDNESSANELGAAGGSLAEAVNRVRSGASA